MTINKNTSPFSTRNVTLELPLEYRDTLCYGGSIQESRVQFV